jgi:CRP/FNR family transcriptional regulator
MKFKKIGEFNSAEYCSSCNTKCISGLARLRKKEISTFDEFMQKKSFENNEVIPVSAIDHAEVYCIQSGHIKLALNSGPVIRIYGPGDIIGYIGFANEATANDYTLIAIDSVKLCSFDKQLFYSVQEKSPEVAKEFIELLIKEIGLRDERISSLENYSVRNKVAAALISLNKKFGVPSNLGTLINVPIDRKTLAQLSGTVNESLSRVLTDLENSKVIARIGRHIHIQNHSKLEKISLE